MSYKKTIEKLYKILEEELAPELTYHGIHHTKDVHDVCKFYIKHYKIDKDDALSLIHISEPTRLRRISYAVFCLKKKR